MARVLRCSFCGKSEREVAKLAAGPGGLHICDECVEACRLLMAGEGTVPQGFDPATWPDERLLGMLAPLSATLDAHREHLGRIVEVLRSREMSWSRIAEPLGISRQSAWERFG